MTIYHTLRCLREIVSKSQYGVTKGSRPPYHSSTQAKNQAAHGLLGKTPSALQSLLPLQIQRESISANPEGRTGDLDRKLSKEFYRKEGGDLTDWATLTRLLKESRLEMIIRRW
jgi:hypothetical protein